MKSSRIAPLAPSSGLLRTGALLTLLGTSAGLGGCKMSPAMEARTQARGATAPADAATAPAASAPARTPPQPPPPSTPPPARPAPTAPVVTRTPPSPPARPPSAITTAAPTAPVVATPTPLPPTAPPGARKTADRGDRTLGPTPIGQVAPEEAPPVPTGR